MGLSPLRKPALGRVRALSGVAQREQFVTGPLKKGHPRGARRQMPCRQALLQGRGSFWRSAVAGRDGDSGSRETGALLAGSDKGGAPRFSRRNSPGVCGVEWQVTWAVAGNEAGQDHRTVGRGGFRCAFGDFWRWLGYWGCWRTRKLARRGSIRRPRPNMLTSCWRKNHLAAPQRAPTRRPREPTISTTWWTGRSSIEPNSIPSRERP